MNCSVGNDDLSTGQNPEDHPGITGKIAPTTTTKYITAAIQSNVRSGLLLIPLHQELVCASFWHHDMSIPHSQKVIGGSSDVNTDWSRQSVIFATYSGMAGGRFKALVAAAAPPADFLFAGITKAFRSDLNP